MAERRGIVSGTILSHLEDLAAQGSCPDLTHLKFDPDRLKSIHQTFESLATTKLTPVREVLGEEYSYDELRLARLMLKIRPRLKV